MAIIKNKIVSCPDGGRCENECFIADLVAALECAIDALEFYAEGYEGEDTATEALAEIRKRNIKDWQPC